MMAVAGVLFLLVPFLRTDQEEQPHRQNQNEGKVVSKEHVFLNDPLLQQGAYLGIVEPSFEMRENVDFILTPAMLVQESISEGVIITYPEE